MANGVTDTDKGWRRINKQLRTLKGAYTTIGFHQGKVHDKSRDKGTGKNKRRTVVVSKPNQPDVATIAAWMVFGTKRIPRRDFMGQATEIYREDLHRLRESLLSQIYEGKIDVRDALAVLGQRHEDQIKRTIVTFPWTPNKQATVKEKGSSKPLIDTGQMLQSVRHVEHIKGE